ncbi:T9SS type A sorting domain-containing protein [Fluviicola taffensis]|uniref:Secretion system C-terminal sorting domain-containing protein n=1 Tax=Fluviicola taffensis (strain DSM 16823 / NCIMB 13979 / RW262) TaxID=755732 RepID=F2IJX9_FLUTR|nr:T9SS type A sorting domain-containing protein [Fluviicola taffensis]AEA45038.1 hypothetical protein Fluta_3062 [Fluviicola taffensis DSM 16823]
MGRFFSISLFAALISNAFVFAQKQTPNPIRLLVQETRVIAPFISNELPTTSESGSSAPVTMHVYNNMSSNYLTLEVLGASKVMEFQLINEDGQEMYSGTIRGTQLVEIESWPTGTYYFLCGSKREKIDLTK